MRISKIIYTIWCVCWLAITFLACYPLMFIGALHPRVHILTHYMNKVWGVLFFTGAGLFYKKIGEASTTKPTIFCVNHSSYLDIPLLFLTIPGFFMVIGKSELRKVPLFGFVFSRVYITVNRKNAKDSYESYQQCAEALDRGVNVVFFPEGTIPKNLAPKLGRFKEGAFKLAIEKKVSLIPVTLPYNWIIFPDYGNRLVTLKRPLAVFHAPIDTQNLGLEDVDSLKQQAYELISSEIQKYNA